MFANIKKRDWIIGLVLFLITLSWTGVADRYTSDYVDDSIVEASVSYASARGINATISVLQSSTIDVNLLAIGGSITVGEALDPFNDLIERFSQVISVALASLALQKILLVLVSHGIFKILITVSGVVVIGALLLKKNGIVVPAVRFLVVVAFIRFSLVLALSLNSVVDNIFLKDQVVEGTSNLQYLESGLKKSDANRLRLTKDKINKLKASNKLYQTKIKSIDSNRASLTQQRGGIESEIQSISARITKEEQALEGLQDIESDKCGGALGKVRNVFKSEVNSECTQAKSSVKAKVNEISLLESNYDRFKNNLNDVKDDVDDLTDQIKKLKELIENNNNELSGKVSWWESAFSSVESQVDNITNNISNHVQEVLQLLVLFLLGTILIPILFFYSTIKIVKSLWAIDWSEYLSLYE